MSQSAIIVVLVPGEVLVYPIVSLVFPGRILPPLQPPPLMCASVASREHTVAKFLHTCFLPTAPCNPCCHVYSDTLSGFEFAHDVFFFLFLYVQGQDQCTPCAANSYSQMGYDQCVPCSLDQADAATNYRGWILNGDMEYEDFTDGVCVAGSSWGVFHGCLGMPLFLNMLPAVMNLCRHPLVSHLRSHDCTGTVELHWYSVHHQHRQSHQLCHADDCPRFQYSV